MPRTQVAEFTIDRVDVLAADGEYDADAAPDLTDEELLDLYRTMRRARRLDEKAIALQRRGELGTYAPGIGQEAAQVGSAFAMREDDWLVPSFREAAAYLTRGVPMEAILTYAAGMEEGGASPPEERNLPPAIPTGSQALHGAGLGWAEAMRASDRAAVTYFGDGASSEGDVYEALNVAGVFDSQAVFLCQNNQWAISVPREKQTRAATIAQKAVAAGIEGVQVDGNDVLGVYAVVSEALERAREGDPTLVEAITYRRSMHTTSDDPSVYRSADEESEWEARDPITRFEAHLRERGVVDDDRVAEIESRIEEELDEAVAATEAARERADPAEMFQHAFGDPPAALRRQRDSFEEGPR